MYGQTEKVVIHKMWNVIVMPGCMSLSYVSGDLINNIIVCVCVCIYIYSLALLGFCCDYTQQVFN